MKSFSINEALSFGWEAFKARFGFFIGLVLLFGVLTIIPQFIVKSVGDVVWLTVILAIAAQLFQYFLAVGMIKTMLSIVDGGQPEIGELFSGGPVFVPYVLGSILYGIAVGLGILLLVLPGIYISLAFALYGYVIIDKGLGPIEALKASYAITKGVMWKLLGFFLLISLLNVVGALLVGLGLLITAPVSVVAIAYVYRQLSSQTQAWIA
jgi:uncharacterized membrane protein